MKLEPDPLVPDQYVTVRGVVYVRQTRWGAVAQAWPRPGPRGNSAGQKWRRAEFGLVAASLSNRRSTEYETAVNLAKGTNFVPRDILMMTQMGTFYEIVDETGKVWRGWRFVVDNVQDVLEQLTNLPGALIMRGVDFWEYIEVGNNGDVLTIVDGVPAYAPATGGGGGGTTITEYGGQDILPAITQSFSSGFLRVLAVRLINGTVIQSFKLYAGAAAATAKIVPVIYAFSGQNPGALIRKGPQITGVVAGSNKFAFDSSWTVPGTGFYYFGFQQTVAAVPLAKGPTRPYCFVASTGAIPDPFGTVSTSLTEAMPMWLSTDAP